MHDQKSKFIAALKAFVSYAGERTADEYGRPNYSPSRGEVTLMRGVLQCLTDTPEPEYVSWLQYLDHFLVDAFNAIREHASFTSLRDAYREQTDHEVPDLYEIHVGGLHRIIVLQSLARLCGVLSGEEWVRPRLEAAFGAQSAVVDQAWSRFVAKAYRPFMARINAERHRTNAGTFGATTLTTFACAGRVSFNFTRRDGSDVTFVADDGDPDGIRSGMNITATRYDKCVSMIEEVTERWSMEEMRAEP